MNVIEVKGLTKSFQTGLFRRQIILRDIDLTVQQGDFVVLRGANGAGKSTLIKIILGLQDPDTGTGSVQLFGTSPRIPESKLQIGTVFQEVNPPNSLKVKELINLVRSYYPNPIPTEEVLETVGLTDKQNAFPSDLAGGQKQRLYFAIALVGNPELLILDEPTKNLDVEGQAAFWDQVESCKHRGVTILMITHIQSEQERLKDLATHIITLADGKLNFDKEPSQVEQFETNPDQLEANQQLKSLFSYQSASPSKMLAEQTWAEILQLFRNPAYLAGIFLFSALVALMPFENGSAMLQKGIAFFSAISLLIFSVERLGKRIAIERVEGWLKLLRVTPLRPSIYLAAKLLMTMLVLVTSLSTIFAIGIFKFELDQSFTQWLELSASLLLGIIPFTAIGLALGYIVPPKALDSIAGLLIPLGAFSCGLMPIQDPSYIQDLIVVSPFFHYREIVQRAVDMGYDNQLFLHVLWLALYTVIASLIAKLAYERDTLVQ